MVAYVGRILQWMVSQWPSNKNNPDGTRIMHQTQFTRGRGQMEAIPFRYAAELPDSEYPLVPTTAVCWSSSIQVPWLAKQKG